jgi:hypothetical protein
VPRPHKIEKLHQHFLHLQYLDRHDAERFIASGTLGVLHKNIPTLNLLEIPIQSFVRYNFVSTKESSSRTV